MQNWPLAGPAMECNTISLTFNNLLISVKQVMVGSDVKSCSGYLKIINIILYSSVLD